VHAPVVSKATQITLRAAPGQREALVALLVAGRDIVARSEPGTIHWFALQSEADPDELAIVDLFVDQRGRAAHFEGQVAAALKARADVLVEGGWHEGVLARAVHYDVLAAK